MIDPQEFLAHRLDREATAGLTAGLTADLSLEPVEQLCHALGDPQHVAPVIHLTGTNGKGTVAHLVDAAIRSHGLRVGRFTSPHLHRVNERITIDDVPLTDGELAAAFESVATAEIVTGLQASYFEALTVAAFEAFVAASVHAAVVEVGLLGRFDATNVVDPSVALVTTIGEDHTDGTGDWRRRIAEEKAGIIKPGSTAVIGPVGDDVADRFLAEPASEHWLWGRDIHLRSDTADGAHGGRTISYTTPRGSHEVELGLIGEHQAVNAVLAGAALDAFFDRPTDDSVLSEAWHGIEIPGRFEVIGDDPPVVLDVAHNADAATALAAALRSRFGRRPRVVVLGLLDDRRVEGVVEALDLEARDTVIVCVPPSARAVPGPVLADALSSTAASVEVVDDPLAALECARSGVEADEVIVACGSFQVVGPIRTAIT